MHPAPSIIVFTVLSGLGFGLMIWLGLGFPSVTGWVAFAFFAIAFALAGIGLAASTFHLGNPQRALKAFTQWRTSWLSREAWLAVITMTLMGLYGAGLVFFGVRLTPIGWLGAVSALATVYATSMIYGQLRTVPRWNSPATPVLFLLFSLGGGALLAGEIGSAKILLTLCALGQIGAWALGDTALEDSGTTLSSATGLGKGGTVRAFEPPHTGTNYLLREFVHVVGRTHALKLRGIALVLGYILPVMLLALPFSHFWGLLAVLSHIAGIAASRRPFFADADHVWGAYFVTV